MLWVYILRTYLDTAAPQLARIPVILAVHAASDMTSFFADTKLMVDTVKGLGHDCVGLKDLATVQGGFNPMKCGMVSCEFSGTCAM